MIRKVLKYIKKYLWRWRMKLNQEKLMQVINKEWKSKQCPMCGNNDWTIDPDIMTMLPVDEERSVQLGGKFVPIVAVTCNKCGNVVLINPLAIHCLDGLEG